MTLTLNCLPEGETLDDVVRRNCAIGFDLRFAAASPYLRTTAKPLPATRPRLNLPRFTP